MVATTVESLILREGEGSLSTIVPMPWPSVTFAFGADDITVKVSFGSSRVSPTTGTAIDFVVSPGLNVTVWFVIAV